MSWLAHAGDSSTVSPRCASAAARATASSMLAACTVLATGSSTRVELGRRGADQHGGAQLAARARGERREVLAFAQTSGDQHERTGETLESGERGTDVRALRVVDERDAAALGHALAAMRQAREGAQRIEGSSEVGRELGRQRERGECIGLVVRAAELELGAAQQRLAIAREPALAVAQHDRVAAGKLALDREPHDAGMACAHRGDERIVGIDDRVLGRLRAVSL